MLIGILIAGYPAAHVLPVLLYLRSFEMLIKNHPVQVFSTFRVHAAAALSAFFMLLFAVSANAVPRDPDLLPATARGKQALELLKERVARVARINKLSAGELRVRLRHDSTLWVDRKGRLFHVEPKLTKEQIQGAEESSWIDPTTIPGSEAFLLESRPGAPRQIYLDFNGHTVSGSAWASGATINAPSFDLDGAPGTFDETERARIVTIWRMVAEDFAPFNVNVTTREPTTLTGSRVVITRADSRLCSSCGGVAYVGVFNGSSYYQPAWVFFDALGNGHAKYVAEAISHEAGHNLGLHHDGVSGGATYYGGHNGWAPIMGVGYYSEMTQWSKGEYSGANNTQDDLNTIAGYTPLIADDFGNTRESAQLFSAGASFAASGMISTRTDVDLFRIQAAAGTLTVTAAPSHTSPNLKLSLELLDQSGSPIATATSIGASPASISHVVETGYYYLRVDGIGSGTALTGFTDYASLGGYQLAGSMPDSNGNFPPLALAVASKISGEIPLNVTFDGGSSVDSDGSIISYDWTFGDGSSATGAQASHTYTAVGTYAATLTVTDNQGALDTDTVSITVLSANEAPTASLSVSSSSGSAPLPVTFSGANSSDIDGTIVSYHWNFGDGTSTITTTPSVSYTYRSAGTFVASLTVTDDRGATASATTQVMVTLDQSTVLTVDSLSLSIVSVQKGRKLVATAIVKNTLGAVISGVKVTGQWSGIVTGSGSATTNISGVASISSKQFTKAGSATFRITGLVKTGHTFDGELRSATIQVN